MKKTKQQKLETKGWKVGTAKEFLNLSDEEEARIKSKSDHQCEKTRNSGLH